MSQVNSILRKGQTAFFYWCPACEMVHPLPNSWTFNGNVEKPTFSPSFAQGYTHWSGGVDEATGRGIGEKSQRTCHYIITDGRIQFCTDSWHGRSDIVEMPAIPPHLADEEF